MIRAAILALAIAAAALPAAAHKLRIFASVEEGMVHVEATFSNGRVPQSGEVRVLDAAEQLIMTVPIDPDGITSFPVTEAAADGLIIKIELSDGHDDYWLLTPEDIAKGRKGD